MARRAWQTAFRVYVPSMMPVLLETLRISMIFNFTGVMIAEMYASRTGIGHLIANWGENFQMRQLFAGVILLAAVAILFNETVRIWKHDAARGERDPAARRAAAPRSRSAMSAMSMRAAKAGVAGAARTSRSTVEPGHFVVHRRPERLRQDLAADDAGGPASADARHDPVRGAPIAEPDPERVGVVFQEASLFPWLTALDNIEFPLALRGVAEGRAPGQRAEAMLNLVGLEGFGARYPHELSGGMKQRVSIARGLVQDPPVLLMDEPFAALDEQTRMTMGHELLRIWSPTKKTVVFITHSLTEAVYLADEVLVMSARPGRIIDRIEVDLPRPRTYDMMATDTFGRCAIASGSRSGSRPDALALPATVRWLILVIMLLVRGSCAADRPHPRTVPAVAVEDADRAVERPGRIRPCARRHALRGRVRDADRLRRRHPVRRPRRRLRAAARSCCCRCSPASMRCRS